MNLIFYYWMLLHDFVSVTKDLLHCVSKHNWVAGPAPSNFCDLL